MRWMWIGLVAFVLLWDPAWSLMGVNQLFPWELKRMLREHPPGTEGGVVLADVRTPVEYGLFRIPGAVNMPTLPLTPEILDDANRFPSDRPVVAVCMTGHRSPPTAKAVQRHDEENGTQRKVYNLTGGMLAWLLFFGDTDWGRSGGAGR